MNHGIDDKPPAGASMCLAVQHVLAAFAGIVAVPLIVADALGMPAGEKAFLVNAALVAAGVATFVQSRGFGPVGSRLPFVCGTDFTFVQPAIVVGKSHGFSGVLGGAILGSFIEIFIGFVFPRIRKYFPTLVTGTVVLLIGLTLIPVAADWCAGGFGAPDYGAPGHLALAGFVLAVILFVNHFTTGFLSSIAALVGIVAGYGVSIAIGDVSFAPVRAASLFEFPVPLTYKPTFSLAVALPFVVAYVVTSIETIGQVYAAAEVTGVPVDSRMLRGGILGDGVSSLFAGFLNAQPNNAFSQNIGLIKLTGVASRRVVLCAGGVLIALGLFPKLGALVAVMPPPVLGGAGLVMFGLVAAAGVEMLRSVEPTTRNLLIIGVAIAAGVGVIARPGLFAGLPRGMQDFLNSGITVGGLTVFGLNLILNHRVRPQYDESVKL